MIDKNTVYYENYIIVILYCYIILLWKQLQLHTNLFQDSNIQ